ncbi:MAG TPA: hypothetical protein DDY78_19545 [Planctomycetales bacterium]|jgi:uncharacterized protein (UPF0332 family)|nr:hypothetical protein [Planctomycetales bacterium]
MLWNEFQDTAERLTRGTAEGDWRSAISRTYYAVFHFFRKFFLTHGVDVGQGGQSHFNLYAGLANCGYASIENLGGQLDMLRRNRIAADYNLSSPIDKAFALAAVQRSRALVAVFQALLGTVPASQIAAGAKRYLKSIGHIR